MTTTKKIQNNAYIRRGKKKNKREEKKLKINNKLNICFLFLLKQQINKQNQNLCNIYTFSCV